jgi:hypothetical protein
MRTHISSCLRIAVFCSLGLMIFACERTANTPLTSGPRSARAPEAAQSQPSAGQAGGVSAEPPSGQAAVPQTPETRQRAVEVDPRTAAAENRDLRTRERQVGAREAALAARERRLRQREDAGKPAPSPLSAPAPEASRPTLSEPAPGPVPAPRSEAEPPRTAPVTVAAGTTFEVEFAGGLASNTSSVGDTFRARVVSDVLQDGTVAIPAGSEVLGVVADAAGVRRIGGQAKLALSFTDLVLPSGATVPIRATFLEQGKSKVGKDAATIGGATAGGAILGRILGQGNRGKGTILGAIIGAAAGTAIASRSAGEEVVIPEGSVIHLQLTGAVDVRPPS